jgi:hypothetical protein
MDSFDPELSIKIKGKDLIITLPGTLYSVTYLAWPCARKGFETRTS